MFEFAAEISLASDKNKVYYGMAYDGHQTYLSSDDRQISILNNSCSLINQVSTYGSYHTICYDCILKHFWAASFDRPGVLICLSDKLEELETVNLDSQTPTPMVINHLFYDANGKQLYLTAENQIFTADKTGALQKLFEINGGKNKLEGICAYGSYLLCLSSQKDEGYLSIHTLSNGNLLEEHIIHAPFKVSAMIMVQDPLNPLSLYLRLLAVKQDNCAFLVDYKPDLSFFTQYSADYLTAENQADTPSNIHIQQLCGNRAPNPFFTPGYRGGNNNGQTNPRNMSHNCPVPPANFCSNTCPYCCPGCQHNCRPDCNCCQSSADVIESIALTEASIAHILNAEGEKLQKAIACSRNISDLLKVNESVVKTITHSTHLEQMLFYKLETIVNTGCRDCHLPPHTCSHELKPQNKTSDPICE